MIQGQKEQQAKALSARHTGKTGKIVTTILLLCGLGGGGWWWWTTMGPGKPAVTVNLKDIITVKKGSVAVRVTATGVIRPYNQVKISPKQTGLLKHLRVQQGDVVKAGQLIAEMDASNLQGQYQAAQAAYNVARSNYEKASHGNRPQEVADAEAQVRKAESLVRFGTNAVERAHSELKAAEANVVRDKTNAARLTLLASQGAVSDQERLNAATTEQVTNATLEKVKQELKQAEQSLSQYKAELESSKMRLSMSREGVRSEDLNAARHAMVQAEGNLKFIASQLNDTRILAPFDGIITQKYTDEGAIVTPTTSAATQSATSSSIVSLAGRLEMVAAVAETDMQHIHDGQEVTIVANAYPDKKFHGKVTLVAPEAIVTLNVTSFEVHTSIDDDPTHKLMSGMNVYATFKAGNRDNMLTVPTACIATKQGKTGVYVPDEKGLPQFRPVMVGPSAGTTTAVTEGLKEGDRVFLGLTKEQLTEEGYGDNSKMRGGPGGSGSGSGAPIPRGLGKKM